MVHFYLDDFDLFQGSGYDCLPLSHCDTLNELLGGGLRTDNFYVIQAPTGVGKSTTLMRWALDGITQKKQVMYITIGEQDEREILERMTCMYYGWSYPKFVEMYNDKKGLMNEGSDSSVMYAKAISFVLNYQNYIYVHYSDNPFNERIVFKDEKGQEHNHNKMSQWMTEAVDNDVKYIFIDYLGSCLGETADSQYTYLAGLAASLKSFATKYHLCVVTAMQTNRALIADLQKQKEIQVDEFYMSDSIGPARKCTTGMSLYKQGDDYYFEVWKNRLNGKKGKIKIDIEPLTYRWMEVQDE